MPPRYGKTEMAVICFIAWSIAKDPDSKFIHLSYSDDLALDNSAQVKEIVLSKEFQELWPVTLKKDSKSVKKWYTNTRGGVYSTSAGGPVTGFGAGTMKSGVYAGAVIIDDPLKVDDADSPTIRSKTNKRLNTTIKNRINNRNTPIIIIMQRIHDEDMSGFVLAGGTGEHWEHLNIPVVNDDGTALWPEKHTLDELAVMEKADRYTYSGQYMQQPIPDEGIFFTKDNIRWYDTLPAELNFYGASDYAVTDGGGDFTEHGVFGIDADDNIYIADWWSGQTKSDVWIEEQLELIQSYNVLKWAGETGPIKSAVEPFLSLRMRQRRIYSVLEWLSHAKNNKEANARTFQALFEAGKVYFPKSAPWVTELVSQLTRFPLGKYDDKVDVCSLFARMINEVWAAVAENTATNDTNKDRYDKAWDDDEGDSWKLA
ncbi:phage terminase large subunit [bacterium]|nr:phage terminase large subunit [bacterium]